MVQEPPFRFGQVVSGDYFVGRSAEIASLTVDLRTATNVVLISPRRFGKTSLVLRVLRDLDGEGVLVAYVDLLRTPSKERFASHFASAIYHGLLGPGAQALQRATEWFGQLRVRPKITLNQDGTHYFDYHHTPDDTLDKVDIHSRRGYCVLEAEEAVGREEELRNRAVRAGVDFAFQIVEVGRNRPGIGMAFWVGRN